MDRRISGLCLLRRQNKSFLATSILCGMITKTETQKNSEGKTKMSLRRYMICSPVNGWHENRDPHGRIRHVEEGDVALVKRMQMTKEEFENTKKQGVAA